MKDDLPLFKVTNLNYKHNIVLQTMDEEQTLLLHVGCGLY
jgi:hypothetical protein